MKIHLSQAGFILVTHFLLIYWFEWSVPISLTVLVSFQVATTVAIVSAWTWSPSHASGQRSATSRSTSSASALRSDWTVRTTAVQSVARQFHWVRMSSILLRMSFEPAVNVGRFESKSHTLKTWQKGLSDRGCAKWSQTVWLHGPILLQHMSLEWHGHHPSTRHPQLGVWTPQGTLDTHSKIDWTWTFLKSWTCRDVSLPSNGMHSSDRAAWCGKLLGNRLNFSLSRV